MQNLVVVKRKSKKEKKKPEKRDAGSLPLKRLGRHHGRRHGAMSKLGAKREYYAVTVCKEKKLVRVDEADRRTPRLAGTSNDFVLCSNGNRYALGCTCSSTASSAID